MKLSEMTTEQLLARRARIDRVLARRAAAFVKLFMQSHDALLELHKSTGGKVFRGTFPELLNKVGFDPERKCDDAWPEVLGNRTYVSSSYYDEAVSVFGDKAHYDQAESSFNEYSSDKTRKWIVFPIKNSRTQVRLRLLTDAEALALLRVSGKEVTE